MAGRRWLSPTVALTLAATALASLAVIADVRPVSAAAALPDGFVLRDVGTGQQAYDLTSFAYLPDGSVLTTGKSGRVTWVPAGGGSARTIAQLRTETTGDLGLIGIAAAIDYARTGHVFLARSIVTGSSDHLLRLSRFTVRGGSSPTSLGDEKQLLQLSASSVIHGMTDVVAADDGTLWVSIGDLRYASGVKRGALEALSLGKPAGKLLHINNRGAGVPTNPYFDAERPRSWRSRVYARGLRSPFRFSLDPVTRRPILGDVGWNTWEEVNLVTPGANYAWPCWEGPEQAPGYTDLPRCAGVSNTDPLWYYHHGSGSDQGNSVTGGIVYEGTSYPAAYRGAYFFGDYTGNKLWTMRLGDGGLAVSPQDPPFATDIGGPVKFAAAPNGDIVYADIISGSLRRLTYSPGNRAPVARATTRSDPATRTVTFDAGGSSDLDGDRLSYRWTFGDGTTGRGRRVSHTYAATGATFRARLTVTDDLGASARLNLTVVPSNHTPVLTLDRPRRSRFAVGDRIRLSATARDAEDGSLTVRWTTALVHCAQASTCHRHPGTASKGARWTGRFTDHPDSRLEVTATVRDSVGVSATKTFVARPRQHLLTLASTSPALLRIGTEPGVRTAQVTEGASVEVVAARRAADGFARFNGWSDGSSARTRTVRMGTRDLTLRARYLTPIDERYDSSRRLQRVLGRPVGREVAADAVRHRRYQHGRLYWTSATGVHRIAGPILHKYLARGGPTSLGVPVIDVRSTRDGRGRYVDLSRKASIYRSPATGTHLVQGPIRRRWVRMGRAGSSLGFPTTDVRRVAGGLRCEFEHGSIRYRTATGTTVVRRS